MRLEGDLPAFCRARATLLAHGIDMAIVPSATLDPVLQAPDPGTLLEVTFIRGADELEAFRLAATWAAILHDRIPVRRNGRLVAYVHEGETIGEKRS